MVLIVAFRSTVGTGAKGTTASLDMFIGLETKRGSGEPLRAENFYSDGRRT